MKKMEFGPGIFQLLFRLSEGGGGTCSLCASGDGARSEGKELKGLEGLVLD